MDKYQMLEGRARGGPLNRVKLSASYAWDGTIIKAQSKDYVTFHQGKYTWEPWERVWVWRDEVIPRKANRRNQTRVDY
jgi:hypothetical protein